MKSDCILISTEVVEELDDIIRTLEKKEFLKDKTVAILVSDKLNLEKSNQKSKLKITHLFIEKSLFSIGFFQKVYGLMFFLKVILVTRPFLLFTGFSMFKHRLMSKIFNLEHTAYFRGLMFDPENLSGFSDNLRYGSLGFLFKKSYLFNAYQADWVVTVSELNKKFIVARGVEQNKISLINPPWLENILPVVKSDDYQVCEIAFFTQAFKEHGHVLQHDSQVSFLKRLDEWCVSCEKKLIIRVHPRDYYDYSSECFKSEVKYDKTLSTDFLRRLSRKKLLISPLSTLAFESLYLGASVVFYSTENLDFLYKKSYENLQIKPIYMVHLESKRCNLQSYTVSNLNVFAKVLDHD